MPFGAFKGDASTPGLPCRLARGSSPSLLIPVTSVVGSTPSSSASVSTESFSTKTGCNTAPDADTSGNSTHSCLADLVSSARSGTTCNSLV
jgi:hypothetical protein